MIEFKKTVKDLLPYNRKQYIKFLYGESNTPPEWYGVSFQLEMKEERISLAKFVEKYESWFHAIILGVGKDSTWIVNHDKKDLNWFPNHGSSLMDLRNLFKQQNVSDTFKGAIVFAKKDLLEYSKDLISYPYSVFEEDGLFYMNLDISNNKLPFVIKILDHLNIDLLSTNKDLLMEVVNTNNSNGFILKPYRGTSL